MTDSELFEMVEKDLELNKAELDSESLKIPQLHNKYLILFNKEKKKLYALENSLKTLRRFKTEYYTGKSSEEDLKERGLDPFPYKVLKSEAFSYVDSDKEVLALLESMDAQRDIVFYLESTIKNIQNRHWYIRSAIDWIKFTSGTN